MGDWRGTVLIGVLLLGEASCTSPQLRSSGTKQAKTRAGSGAVRADAMQGLGVVPILAPGLPDSRTEQPPDLVAPATKLRHRPPVSGALFALDTLDVRTLPAVSAPQVLGTLVGPGAASSDGSIQPYGTDLGASFVHDGKLVVLFGDTWSDARSICDNGPPTNDDTMATLPLQYPGGIPPLSFVTRTDPMTNASSLATIEVLRGTTSLSLGYGQAPITGWSDGVNAFAIFSRLEAVRCDDESLTPAAACPTQDYFFCSKQLGVCQPSYMAFGIPCDAERGEGCLAGQNCVAAPLCVDTTSSQYDDGHFRSQAFAVAQPTEIAVQREPGKTTFDSVLAWPTNKFSQPTARTVASFTGRRDGNDYRPGHGELLLWGRPGMTAEHGREAQLYLMTHALPMTIDGSGALQFEPRYFAGLDPATGEPTWSDLQSDAAPLALDGVGGGEPHEELFVPVEMSVSWLGPPIDKWVMLYGGDLADYLIQDPASARDPRAPGAIMMRFADHPWGPFSAPIPHLVPGSPAFAGDLRGPGGILYSPDCTSGGGLSCAATDPNRPPDSVLPGCPISVTDPGRLYSPAIIDSYTTPNADGGLDMFWNVSTWNPYAVKLMKTSFRPPPSTPPLDEIADERALSRMSNWRALPVLDQGHRYVQQSSHDRGTTDSTFPLSDHGNRDFNNFICASADAHMSSNQFAPFEFDQPQCQESYVHGVVLGRFEGAGQLVRTWIGMQSLLSGPADDEVLRVYVDDEPTPRVDVPLAAAINGRAGEIFAPPFGAGSDHRLAWYYPVAFRHKLIVALDGLGDYDEYFYHCDVTFDDALPVAPQSRERLPERTRATSQLGAVFRPAGELSTLQAEQSIELAAGGSSAVHLAGPATIQELRIRATTDALTAMADVRVTVHWDGAAEAAIDLPLLDLLGAGRIPPERSSLALSSFVEEGEQVLALKLPMPFTDTADWTFSNTGTAAVAFDLLVRGDGWLPPGTPSHLYVQRNETVGPTSAPDHVAVDITGTGRLVGVCAYVAGHADPSGGVQSDPLNCLEGDVRAEVDGALALDGTGTEEYADDVFYFTDAPQVGPFVEAWGRVSDSQSGQGEASFCRWHVLGTELDFHSSLRETFELGGAANPSIVDRFRTVAFLYLAK
ncbi:MAG: DUF2961 domain-containing protein [Polyangiales bacterium]